MTHRELAEATALLDLATHACAALGRPDLAARVEAARAALGDAGRCLVVVGDFKQGKSSLVNALVGAEVCPVDDNLATVAPTSVRWGAEPGAELVFAHRRQPVSVEEAGRHAIEGAAGGGPGMRAVDIRLPVGLLESGLVVVDTPGVGGLASASGAANLAAVATAGAALFVTDAEQELSGAEAAFLRRARGLSETVLCVLTKTDFYPRWPVVKASVEQHAGQPVLPVSVPLRALALRAGDAELDAESGIPALIETINGRMPGAAAKRAAAEVIAVCDAAAVPAEDASAEFARDAAVRISNVIMEADDAIESSDPADTWAQMGSWLQSRVAHELIESYALLWRRTGKPRGLTFTVLGDLAAIPLDPVDVGITLVMGHRSAYNEKERQLRDRRDQARTAVRRFCERAGALVSADGRATIEGVPAATASSLVNEGVDLARLRARAAAVLS
jgi:hypothetical protein